MQYILQLSIFGGNLIININFEIYGSYYRRLNNNKLSGSIPRELVQLSNLKVL